MKHFNTTMKIPLCDPCSHLLQKWLQRNASHPIKANRKKRGHAFHQSFYLLIIVFLSLTAATTAYPKDPYELVVGVRVDAPPFSFCSVAPPGESVTGDEGIYCPDVADNSDTNSDSGRKYQGYTVDLCKRIIKRAVQEEGLYCSVRYKELTSKDRFELLKNNEIDLLCGATTVTLERLRVADFSLFTFLSGASLMYSQSDSEENDEPKKSLNVGVLEKTTTLEQVRDIISNLQQHEDDFEPIILQNVEITPYSNHYAGLYGLLDEEIDAYIADREILLALQKKGKQILAAKREQMLNDRNKVKQSIWYVLFNDGVGNENKSELNFGVLNSITEEQIKQIISNMKMPEADITELMPDESQVFSNYSDGLFALANKEIQAFITDNGIFKALQSSEEELLEAQTNNETIKHIADMKIIIVSEKPEENTNADKTDGDEKNKTDMELIVLRDYFTVEPYAIGIQLGATDLRYIADKVLNEMFAWNTNGTSEIYTILQRNFPGKKFSKSIENMFRLQRVSVGTRVADEFLPRIPRAECKEWENSSVPPKGTHLATSP